MDWSEVVSVGNFDGIIEGITSLMPVIIGVCAPLIGIRKAWDFLKGNIYSA